MIIVKVNEYSKHKTEFTDDINYSILRSNYEAVINRRRGARQ